MRQHRFDFLLNVALPLLVGTLLYAVPLTGFLRNHLPDALWAYALASCLLWLHGRRPHRGWLLAGVGMTVLFEAGQYLQWLPGTADGRDLLIYFLFFLLALGLNPFFKPKLHE